MKLSEPIRTFLIPESYEAAMPLLTEYRERKIPLRLAAKILTHHDGPSGDIVSADGKHYLSSETASGGYLVTVREVL